MLMVLGASDVFEPLFAGAPTLWENLTNDYAGVKLGIMWTCSALFVLGVYSITRAILLIMGALNKLESLADSYQPSERFATKRAPDPSTRTRLGGIWGGVKNALNVR